MPVWAYLLAAYLGWSLLKIRTYLEHRAHEAARARTVVIESRGPLALLFLNNNFHVVHHMHPGGGVVPAARPVPRQPRPLPAPQRRLPLPQLCRDLPPATCSCAPRTRCRIRSGRWSRGAVDRHAECPPNSTIAPREARWQNGRWNPGSSSRWPPQSDASPAAPEAAEGAWPVNRGRDVCAVLLQCASGDRRAGRAAHVPAAIGRHGRG